MVWAIIVVISFRCVFEKLAIMLFAKIFEKSDFDIKKLSVFRIFIEIARIIVSNSSKKFDDVDMKIIDESKDVLSINKEF